MPPTSETANSQAEFVLQTHYGILQEMNCQWCCAAAPEPTGLCIGREGAQELLCQGWAPEPQNVGPSTKGREALIPERSENHGIIQLEKPFKIIKSSRPPSTAVFTTNPGPQVPHPHDF